MLVELAEKVYPFQDVCDALLHFAREEGIKVLDLLPAFRGRDGSELWVSALDQHPNALGHQLAADAMLPFVRALLADAESKRP